MKGQKKGVIREISQWGGEACEESPTALTTTVTSGCLLQCSPALLLNDITVPLPHIPPHNFETSGESAL